MNTSTFWKLGITTAIFCGLTACSDTISSDDDSINTISKDGGSSSSSTGKKGTSSANDEVSSSSKSKIGCDTLSTTLAYPTDLSVVKNGDNKWILFWNYNETEGRPENAFIIETLNMSDTSPKWKILDSTSADVTMFNLVGESKAGKYYRIMAKDQCGISKPTDMIQVSTAGTGSTSASAELAVPTDLKLDTLGNNQWQLSWSYKNNSNRPENGFQLQVLNLNDESPKWKDETSTNKGVHVIKIDGTKKGGLIYHVAAKDSNGVSEYSAEIRIPSATDDNSSNSNTTLELAVPVELKIDSTNLNQWKLSWNYTNNKANPENGFILQALNLEATDGAKWNDAVSVNQGVHYILMDSKKYGGQYIRIAAKNADGKQRSAYSEEIMIPKPISEESAAIAGNDTLAVPTALKLDTLGENIWQISWNYTNNKANPEKGFKIQYLHPDTLLWKDYKDVAEGVHLIKVDAKQNGGCFFRIAALDAKKNTSAYSAEIQVPKYTENASVSAKDNNPLNVPQGLTLDSIGENKWKLSWKYTNSADRPEDGFIIDTLNLTISNAQWSAMNTTNKGVRVFVFDNSQGKYSKLYVHVAARDKNGFSEYSEEIQIPDYIDYSKPAATIELAIPTALKIDSIGENKWKLSWNYTNSARPENGFIVETYDLDGGEGTVWEEVKNLSKGVHYYTFTVNSTDHMKLIHVLAKDANGKSEYSEGIQIPAYKDYNVPPPTIELAIPANLQLDSINPGKYQLTWDYTDNKDRPENGFVLQSLDPKTQTQWTDNAGSTKKGVHVIVIDANQNGGKFYRVAAVDNAGELSGYSKEIQIPFVTAEGTSYTSTDKTPLAIPTDLSVENLGSNKYKIAWNYTNNEKRPENGFTLQKLDANATSPEWKEAGSTNKGVRFIVVTVASNDPELTYRVAAKDSRGLSEYSATIVVPKYSPNAVADGCSGEFVVPSGLTPERIAPNVWRLVWNYNQNSKCKEEKFVIQKVELDENHNKEWKLFAEVPRNVHYLNLEGVDNLNFVYRVAAVRGDDTTNYSNEEILTRSTSYSKEFPFSTPQVKIKLFYYYSDDLDQEKVEFMMIVNGNYPNHAMLYSEYTKQLDYQFRWNGESEAEWHSVTVEKDGTYETTYTKTFDGHSLLNGDFCKSYASVRTIWTQNDKAETKDYTEWSTPIGPLYDGISTTFNIDHDGDPDTPKISRNLCP